MSRYGGMYGPDVTFLGVERCDLGQPATLKGADVVIIGAPYDAGTSYRSGARFGPKMIRTTDYLPHDSYALAQLHRKLDLLAGGARAILTRGLEYARHTLQGWC